MATNSRWHKHISGLMHELRHEIERFFHSYNEAKGGETKLLGQAPKQPTTSTGNWALTRLLVLLKRAWPTGTPAGFAKVLPLRVGRAEITPSVTSLSV